MALDTFADALRSDETMARAAVMLVLVAFFLKAAIVPFHAWAPDAYEGAAVPVTAYMATIVKAGVLLDASGLQPSSKGTRIKYSGGKRTIVDGPFTEAKELIAGYTLIQVKSKEEAMEWAKRFPNPSGEHADGEIEIRQLFELEDFGPSEAVERFRDIGVGTKK